MKFKIFYYSDNDTILGDEVLDYDSYDIAENSVIEKFKDEFIKIKTTGTGNAKEVRTVILTNKIAKIRILDAKPNKVNISGVRLTR